ncbi:hypothetical protein PIB30_107040, partial [Stylosanthes scabra]|nr:hypothetical protein [Stylosanthes scabra]
MQHPEDEEAEECMRTDIIDMLVKEIQDEEILKKSTAYYEETFATFGDTNLEFFVQENNAELQKSEEISENNKEEKDAEKEEATLPNKEEENQVEQKMELKPLPSNLKYAYLGNDESLPVIISSSLIKEEEERQKSLHSTFKNKARKLWDLGSCHSISIGELGLNPYIPP